MYSKLPPFLGNNAPIETYTLHFEQQQHKEVRHHFLWIYDELHGEIYGDIRG